MWLWAWVIILSEWPICLSQSIDLWLSTVNYDVVFKYWCQCVYVLCVLPYVWPDVIVALWDILLKYDSLIMSTTSRTVLYLEVAWFSGTPWIGWWIPSLVILSGRELIQRGSCRGEIFAEGEFQCGQTFCMGDVYSFLSHWVIPAKSSCGFLSDTWEELHWI